MDIKEIMARKCLANKMYMNPATGSVDTGEGWIQTVSTLIMGFQSKNLKAFSRSARL